VTHTPAPAPRAPQPPLRALVVDDEAFARQRVRRLLTREADVEVMGECAGGREAVEAVRRERPDILFLDVQMPELDGFAVLRELAGGAADADEAADAGADALPLVVFVTAYDEHALRAFDVRALDYLLKPVDPERLHLAVTRARAQHAQATAAERHARLVSLLAEVAPAAAPAAGSEPAAASASPGGLPATATPPTQAPARLLVKDDGHMYLVRTADVDWVEACGNYAKLHVGNRTHLMRETMASLEQALEPAGFARLHRSAIVNLDRVKEMQPWFSGDYVAILADGTRLKVSRVYRERLEQRMR
jgi:two-component system LytT family response regulator